MKPKYEPENIAQMPKAEGGGNGSKIMTAVVVLVIIGILIGVIVAMGGSSKTQQGRTPPAAPVAPTPEVILTSS